MSVSHDDPRLTAYALGELSGKELAEFEALLEGDARARAEVAAIGVTTARLTRELERASGPALSERRRESVRAALQPNGSGVTTREEPMPEQAVPRARRWRRRWLLLAAIVPVLGVVMTQWTVERRGHAPRMAAPELSVSPMLHVAPPSDEMGVLDVSPRVVPYDALDENPFTSVASDPRSTFSIDVDTASYSLVRRFLRGNSLPPSGAVRIEELINYFSYAYPEPTGEAPVAIHAAVARAPWNPEHPLVRIGLKARHVDATSRPPANLVFLVDVSGSMLAPNKLELVKYGLLQLTETLGVDDRVSIVTYAGNSGMALAPTSGGQRRKIRQAIDRLEAGGTTNGAAGIELAYSLARQNFVAGNVNRVLLATDGDFNVGVTSQSELVELIQRQAESGVFLSVLGFGDGDYQDSTLEQLADEGNGNYAYIDGAAEARKVLVEQASGTLVTLAKDVKLQIEFNPAEVAGYRLIGYENRALAHQDFNDDSKDAGELGAGHSVTALYELIPARLPNAGVDALKYQRPTAPALPPSDELLTVKLRYQLPSGGASRSIEQAVRGPAQPLTGDFAFAAAVAEFGMLLRNSAHRGRASYEQVLRLTGEALGEGEERRAREQFVELVRTAERLSERGYDPRKH